jgi:hypothetical protein
LAADAAIGKQVENFSLRDFHGKAYSLADDADKKAVVIVMLAADCPMARLYARWSSSRTSSATVVSYF